MGNFPLNKDINFFALTNYRNEQRRFGIKTDDRRRHMYVIGKTGMGKTTMIENMVIQDILNGHGVAYVDPHGDTAEKILDFVPADRINDVIYFNPADTEFPVAFNILESVDEGHKHLIASGLVSVFKKQFAESWGPRLEYILRNTVMALLDYPGSTLLGVMRILVEKDYRNKVVEKIKDPVVRSFWVNEFTKWNDRVLQEVISPIQNKVGQFLSNFLIRNIVGQVKSTFNLRDIMDNNKILILNLSKGRLGEDTTQLLGSMIVTKLYITAMSRVDIPEKDRQDFYLYVDEFQNFATDSFADILSEARKYHLNLIVAHQYIEQLPELVQAAVFGNVGTLVCFRVGAADGTALETEFAPRFTPQDLVNLTKFDVYLKLMIDGVSSDPFSATTLPPLFDDIRTGNAEKVIRCSRERYAVPRTVIEDKISRWSDTTPEVLLPKEKKIITAKWSSGQEKPKAKVESSEKKQQIDSVNFLNSLEINEKNDQEKESSQRVFPGAVIEVEVNGQKIKSEVVDPEVPTRPFPAVCADCQRITFISFKPDNSRPVYCKSCLREVNIRRAAEKKAQLKAGKNQPNKFNNNPPNRPRLVIENDKNQSG